MELIKECFNEYETDFYRCLQSANFSDDEARRFLAEAVIGIARSVQVIGVFQTIHCMSSKRRHVISSKINTQCIADNVGCSHDRVISGLQAIAPLLLIAYTNNKRFKGPDSY